LHEVERLKSDFVALVSHELRTPLTTIKGCTDTLLRGVALSDSARVREFVQIIDEQGERLQELIDNLLSLSQLEAGALRLRRELVAIPPILHGVVRQMADRLSSLRVQVEAPATLPLVSADARRIEQVVSNLLDNACKFSPEGGIVTVRAIARDGNLIVSVSDQGPGIPSGEHEHVFERFYQVEQPATRQVGGSGLGLAICKSLIEAHGGQIWIDDSYTAGTAISFSLPAIPAEDSTQNANGVNLLAREVVGATHVLVVDDDPALRRILDSGLQDAGYQVRTVVEAQAAIEAVTQHTFDIILLDLMLPGVDGFTLCKQLREWTNLPIIMLTARAAEQDIVHGLQAGADDYVTKPFRLNELIARIEAVLRRSKADVAPGELSLIQTGDLTIDLAQRQVTLAREPVDLTPTEYGILMHLARHVGQVLTHEQILKAVWGEDHGDENHYLWVHIAHLRQKIEADTKQPRYIETARGVGYRLARL
jgi:DNA-binding response OmpR family regulator/anti-sigma regulatory factor (Ser/Thr protein kinase)